MSSYSEQFLKQNPLAVLGVLRDLKKGEVPLRINWSTSQFISKIPDVTAEHLIVDLGSQSDENRAALQAENLSVMAETQGAKVEFILPRLTTIVYRGLPAFITPCPLISGSCSAASIFASAPRFTRPTSVRRKCRTKRDPLSSLRPVAGRHGSVDGYAEAGGAGGRYAF